MTQPPSSLPSSHGGCRFFEKLFEIEDDYEEYRIRLVPEGALRQILNWMYSRQIDLTEGNVAEILRTAHYIDCSQVVKMTSDYLSTKMDPKRGGLLEVCCHLSGMATSTFYYSKTQI